MEYVKVLLPSIVVGLIFWYVIRTVLRSDSTERKEMERYYAHVDSVPESDIKDSNAHASSAVKAEHSESADPPIQGDPHGARNQSRPD